MGLPELLERVRSATGADREIEQAIGLRLFKSGEFNQDTNGYPMCPEYTSSIDAAVALVERVLPGWWVSVALCSLSGDSSMAPDYNGPDRARLLAEFPENLWHEGFHADLRPGDGWHRACYAVLDCLLSALIAREEAAAGEARWSLRC